MPVLSSHVSRMRLVVGIAALGVAMMAGQAMAGITLPPMQMWLSVDGAAPIAINPFGTPITPTVTNYTGSLLSPVGAWQLTWNINGDIDPSINGNIAVQNLTGATQTFDLLVMLPVLPVAPTSLIGGSASLGLTTNSNGGTVSTVGAQAGWEALIDGNVVQSMFASPFAINNPGFGSPPAVVQNFGSPIPSMPAVGVATSIGIHIHFSLTSGDQFSMTSVFVVDAVPAPGALAVLAMGALVRRRRR